MPDVVIHPTIMTAKEARQITDEIKYHGELLREKLLRIYESGGYEALGYTSFQAYVDAELTISFQQAYKLVGAAKVDANLTLFSPSGEVIQVPVNHANEFRKLPTPELQYEAFTLARQQAQAQDSDITARTVCQSVQTVVSREVVRSSPHRVVQQMVASDEIPASTGASLVRALDELEPVAQAEVQSLMATSGLKNPDLVKPLGLKVQQEAKTGKTSKVLDEIRRTGHLGGKALHEAKLEDLKKANEAAQKEHISEGDEEKRQKQLLNGEKVEEAVIITVYRNNPNRTLNAIMNALAVDDVQQLYQMLGMLTVGEIRDKCYNGA